MTIDEIFEEWQKDSHVERTELLEANLAVQDLHAKYIKLIFQEKRTLRAYIQNYNEMKLLRQEYWLGTLAKEDLDEKGWLPQPMKIIRSDLPTYMDADRILAKVAIQRDLQQEKVNALDSIIKAISNRGFILGKAIDYEKWIAGR